MSSLSGNYSVESNRAREQRIKAELRSGIDELNEQIKVLESAWVEACKCYGEEFPAKPEMNITNPEKGATIEELRGVEASRRKEILTQKCRLAEANSAFRVRDLLSKVSELVSRPASESRSHDSVKRKPEEIEQRKREVRKAASRLKSSVPDKERRELEKEIENVFGKIETGKYSYLLPNLYHIIQRINKQQERRIAQRSCALELIQKLEGLEGQDVSSLKSTLTEVINGNEELCESAVEDVERVSEAATSAADKEYATRVIIEELQNLGYSIEAGMETVVVERGEFVFRKADMGEYSVQLTMNGEDAQLDLSLTRKEKAGSIGGKERKIMDEQMEETCCGDFEAALSAAEEKGVKAENVRQTGVRVIQRGRNELSRNNQRTLVRNPARQIAGDK